MGTGRFGLNAHVVSVGIFGKKGIMVKGFTLEQLAAQVEAALGVG